MSSHHRNGPKETHRFKPRIAMAALALLALPALSLPALASSFTVSINETRALHLKSPASTVILGNPSIADVTVHRSGILYVLGRSYGKTNLVVLDSEGRETAKMNLDVVAPASQHVTLHRGVGQISYNCGVHCERTPTQGDIKDDFDAVMKQVNDLNGFGNSGAETSGGAQ